jgi:uncharacterized protein (TIGR02145 family)
MRHSSGVFIILFLVLSCKEIDVPVGLNTKTTVEITGISSITHGTARISAKFNCFNTPIVGGGVLYDTILGKFSLDKEALIEYAQDWGAFSDTFSILVDSLRADTKYYLKVYLKSIEFELYSDIVELTTLPPFLPVVNFSGSRFVSTTFIQTGGCIIDNGGFPVLQKGICWNTKGDPTISDNHVLAGTGDSSFSKQIDGLLPFTTYYFRVFANTTLGTDYSDQMKILTYGDGAKSDEGTVTDNQGNIYKTVKIGSQWWMADNLKVTKYNDGSPISKIMNGSLWATSTGGAYCWYGNDSIRSNLGNCGALYNSYITINSSGICPSGWVIPSLSAWDSLRIFLEKNDNSFVAVQKLKSNMPGNWMAGTGTNESGFNALNVGVRSAYGDFEFLTTSFISIPIGSYISMFNGVRTFLSGSGGNPKKGVSVRCMKK